VGHPERCDVELQLADGGENRLAHTDLWANKDLYDTLCRQLEKAAAGSLVARPTSAATAQIVSSGSISLRRGFLPRMFLRVAWLVVVRLERLSRGRA
jgi:hypothetical protein